MASAFPDQGGPRMGKTLRKVDSTKEFIINGVSKIRIPFKKVGFTKENIMDGVPEIGISFRKSGFAKEFIMSGPFP